ncbi:hypothetical protein D9619_002369 [Psilocybe cf. subviscida]|uniref:Uncharacterized protein n=1 Tax=Psilocybe cf. subviscida TaxID=2480587 RepID=A0A8H5AWE7_9AGAR|nr:hypothetical protein D9619_002369 [Psilocybe cf. subviscida]
MSFFAGASDIKISGGTFMNVNNSGTYVNNMNSNNVVDSYNTRSTAMYDSNNNNSRQYSGGGSNIQNDNSPPPPRNYPPPPAVPDWSRAGPPHGYGGGPGYGGGYSSPPHSGQTYNSFNSQNEVYTGSYNDNSRRYGAPPPGDRGPNTRKRSEKPSGGAWMEGDDDDFMSGPSRNPKAGARKPGPSPTSPYAPYGDPARKPPGSAPGGLARGGFGGARRLNVPDMHVKSPGGGHMSVQDAQIAQMGPESQKHFKALFRSLSEEQGSDSEESDAEDKRMAGSVPPKTLSAGIANLTLNDGGRRATGNGPARKGTKSAPPPQDLDEDEDIDGAQQTAPSHPRKKKKAGQNQNPPRQPPGSDDQGDFWDQPGSYPDYSGYPGHPGPSPHPGAYAGPGRGMGYAPHPPPPPPGHYGHGGSYPDPHFQQRHPFDSNYGRSGPYPPYGAPPMGYHGNGNVHNVHMENAYNDNSHVEYHEEEADDDEADEEGGEGDSMSPEQTKGKGNGATTAAKKTTKKKDVATPGAVE